MGADLIVRIVQRYLADYRAVFTDRARLDDLMDCLDVFVRAGWPAAQALLNVSKFPSEESHSKAILFFGRRSVSRFTSKAPASLSAGT